MQDALDRVLFGNTLADWGRAAFIGLTALLVLRLLARRVVKAVQTLAARTSTPLDDLLAHALGSTRFFFMVLVAAWVGGLSLTLGEVARGRFDRVFIIGLLVQGAIWLTAAVVRGVDRYREEVSADDPGAATGLSAISVVARGIVWAFFLLLILDNLGIDVTALITGLGIGGIAVGLAVQNILADLFASVSIILDKPFEVGDFVVVGDKMGTVETVGVKTTRVRALSGEQLVFSNNDLLTSRIQNFKRMNERRITFTVGVTYDTPEEALREIPTIVQQVVETQANTRFDRCHFLSYGDFALNIETVYYMQVPDYAVYADTQQAINLELFRRFAERGIEFAFPTQTLYVERAGTGAGDAAA